MYQDPIVAEVRRVREAHAARYEYDLKAIYQALKEQERKTEMPRVSLPARRISEKQPADGAEARD